MGETKELTERAKRREEVRDGAGRHVLRVPQQTAEGFNQGRERIGSTWTKEGFGTPRALTELGNGGESSAGQAKR